MNVVGVTISKTLTCVLLVCLYNIARRGTTLATNSTPLNKEVIEESVKSLAPVDISVGGDVHMSDLESVSDQDNDEDLPSTSDSEVDDLFEALGSFALGFMDSFESAATQTATPTTVSLFSKDESTLTKPDSPLDNMRQKIIAALGFLGVDLMRDLLDNLDSFLAENVDSIADAVDAMMLEESLLPMFKNMIQQVFGEDGQDLFSFRGDSVDAESAAFDLIGAFLQTEEGFLNQITTTSTTTSNPADPSLVDTVANPDEDSEEAFAASPPPVEYQAKEDTPTNSSSISSSKSSSRPSPRDRNHILLEMRRLAKLA